MNLKLIQGTANRQGLRTKTEIKNYESDPKNDFKLHYVKSDTGDPSNV